MRQASRLTGVVGLTMVVGLLAFPVRPAAAATELGQVCWRLTPFVDTLRLVVTLASGNAPLIEAHVRWRARATAGQQAVGGPGPATYQLLGAGTLTDSLSQPGGIDVGFAAVQATAFFDGNMGCNFFATLTLPALTGTWEVECPGAQGPRFQNTGTLTVLAGCPATD